MYQYTPPADKPTELDEWRLVYHETTTNQDTISYGTIQFDVTGNKFRRFLNVTDDGGQNRALEVYLKTKGVEPNWTGFGSGIKTDN